MSAPSVQLARPIYLGTAGEDVIAVKRALSRAGYMQWGTFTKTWGDYAKQACHAFQQDHKLKPAGYGPMTHHALLNTHKKGSKTEWAYDSLSISLMHQEYVLLAITPEQHIRNTGIQMARYLYEHRMQIGYSQYRPTPLIKLGDTVPSRLDCSGLANVCHYAGGAKNPNVQGGVRLPWNGEGYTGTLLAGGTRVSSINLLKPLDLVFYGFTTRPSPAFSYGSPTHVAVWEGNDNMVFSMGHYPMGHFPYNYGMQINCFVTYDVTP